jgi:putative addiction module CopG family antidote
MPEDRQLVVTVPHKLAEFMQRKIASGKYAGESEVISEGLAILEDREQTIERWLREEVVPAQQAMEADPSRGIPVASVRLDLEADFRYRG